MELKVTTPRMLKILQVLSWIIFIGLCVEAGGILFRLIYTFAVHSDATRNFWNGADLSGLYTFDVGYFVVIVLLMFIVSFLQALLFYLIVKLFVEKTLDISQPFSLGLRTFITNAAWLSLGIGVFEHVGAKYAHWLTRQSVPMPDLTALGMDGASVWIFMAVILFVVSQIVKRGMELQAENDLTI
ncbi:DUF2975 domain-containing protein [Chitinophaga lutea]